MVLEIETVPQKEEVTLRDKYKLWWDYLQRHDEFMESVHWRREWWKGVKRGIDNPNEFQKFLANVPDKLKKETDWGYGFKYDVPCFTAIWVRGYSFDQWWRDFENFYSDEMAVEDYIRGPLQGRWSQFQDDFAQAMQEMKRKVEDALPVDAFGEIFKKEFLRVANSRFRFSVLVHLDKNRSNKELEAEFVRVLNWRRKQLRLGKDALDYKRGRYPLEPFLKKDLERYLKVYDLKKENKSKAQIKELIERDFGSKASYARTLLLDYKIAKEIMGNAAKGLFPKYRR